MNFKEHDTYRSNLERLPKEILIDIIQSNKVVTEQLIEDIQMLEIKLKKTECVTRCLRN